MATKIERAINSQWSKDDRYGKISAIWYEGGQQMTDTIVIDKQERDYQYRKVVAAYDALIAAAPAANRQAIKALVDKFLADVFTDDAYMLSVCQSLDPQQLAKNLVPYYNK